MMDFILAKDTDAPVIARLRQRVWAETYRGIYPDEMIDRFDYDWHIRQDLTRIQSREYLVYLIVEAGRPVGYLNLKTGVPMVLLSLYVLKKYRRRGIGKNAFSLVRQHCAERGISAFICHCQPQNKHAMAFYLAMGGIITHRDEENTESWQNSVTFLFQSDQSTEKEV